MGKVKPSNAAMLMGVMLTIGILIGGTMSEEGVESQDVYVITIGVFVLWAIVTAIIVGAFLAGQDSKDGRE